MARKTKEMPITILEAVDNLTSMAEVSPDEMKKSAPKWLDPKSETKTLSTVKNTFKTLRGYLENVSQDEMQMKDIETQKGLKAIMVLADEATEKLDSFGTLFKKQKISELSEVKDLKTFYMKKIMKRFEQNLELEKAWQEEWGEEGNVLDIERKGLKDLETVKRDRNYELFYIRGEDGRPFFNKNLIRHIKLVTNFDEILEFPEGEDPLLRIKIVQDRDAHISAAEIRETNHSLIEQFTHHSAQYKEDPFIRFLSKATMALFLAANPRNLVQNATGKISLRYMVDFHAFIREALQLTEYQKLISDPPDENSVYHLALTLLHRYCSGLFLRIGERNEMSSLVNRMISGPLKKKKAPRSKNSSLAIWNGLLDAHDQIHSLLEKYPNGPLMKTLDLFNQRDDVVGFDPIGQENLPAKQFTFNYDEFSCDCIRLPSPTFQKIINKAEIVEEFKAFLRDLTRRKDHKSHLLINLQDKTSWEEHARCKAIEEAAQNAEFSKILHVVTLPKNTDFYYQSETYLEMHDVKDFKAAFIDQINSGETCGFAFPKSLQKEIRSFSSKCFDLIHKLFFSSNKALSRKNRMDFIEIFYQMLIFKCIDIYRPSVMSLTCKDALDIGPTATLALFGSMKLLSSNPEFTDDENDFMKIALFTPSLIVRERVIETGRLSRLVSAISVIHAECEGNRKKIVKALQALYGYPLFDEIETKIDS